MMNYSLQKKPGLSLYEDLYKAVKDDILTGRLKGGERLLSKRQLSDQLRISITTVENAYGQLMLEGYIHGEAGRGFFVNQIGQDSGERMELQQESPASELPEPEDDEYLIDFKANQSSLELFPFSIWSRLMRSEMASRDIRMLKTVPYNGVYPLRKAIADYLARSRGMQVSPAQIIVGAGTEYLYSRLLQLMGGDSVIAIEDPGYKKFANISSQQGILWDYIAIDESGIRMDRLRASRANIVHVSPANHFPTGIIMPIARRMELLEWAAEDETRFIIEDDYDSELRYTGKPIPALYNIDQNNRVVYINTFSKSLVPALRISYMVLPPILLERYRRTMSFYSCTVSSFEQLTLAQFISQGFFERHINRLKKYYREKRDTVVEAFHNSGLMKIATIEEADAGTHFLLRVKTGMDDDRIRRAAAERSIHFAMLSDYEHRFSSKNACTIVINYAGIHLGDLPTAIGILEDIFREDLSR